MWDYMAHNETTYISVNLQNNTVYTGTHDTETPYSKGIKTY